MTPKRLCLALLLFALAPVAAVHAEDLGPSTLDVLAGYGSTSTHWDFAPAGYGTSIVHEISGGQALSLRAFLTVPVSAKMSVLGSVTLSGTDRGWLDYTYGFYQARAYFGRDHLSMAELGLRIRL